MQAKYLNFLIDVEKLELNLWFSLTFMNYCKINYALDRKFHLKSWFAYFFTRFTHEERRQNNFSHRNF